VHCLEDLILACREGRVAVTKGLGAALQRKIEQGIIIAGEGAGRLRMNQAQAVLDETIAELQELRPELRSITTGASTGIGYELAKCCAEESFDLVVVADEPEIMTAGKDFEALGAKVDCLQADLAEVEGVDKLCGLIASGQSKRWPTCSTRK